ncbi:hypothetical protein RO865_02255 [Blautia faecis]|uniref:hypothetical protein n=1 Tax=Blautia faecis TaxID=871665 RepID=UPI0028A4963C|nr:hypothetical protein [Blautia faecis]MDT4367661.1 hypothetical protein [Blautia faecis]
MADGTLTIYTETDEKGIKVGMKEIEASVKRMSSSVEGLGEKAKIALQKQLDSISKLNNQYGQQEQKVEALRKRLKELSDQKIETEEYKHLGAEIKKLDNEFEKVEQKQREWLDMGFPADSMKNLDDQLDEIWAKMDKLQKKQAEMKSSGIAYVDPRSLSEYQSTASRLTVEEMRLDDMNNRLNTSFATTEMKLKECGEEAARSSSKFSGLAESARRFAEKLKQSGITGMKQKLHELWQALDKLMSKFMQLASRAIVGGLQKISSGIFGIHKSANKSTLSLKKLMKYVFGIRTLFALFNRIRSAATEGIQNLAQHDLLTNTGKVNLSLSELQSALTQLKNSFATAFAPILTTVSPILVSFINLISQAVTRVGMLIAALTGQKTFVKAIAVQENYAASLDKTANSAKKAAKALQGYLSPIDEINRYDDGKDNSNTGSTGKYTGPSPKDMFEEVPIESSLKGIADKIKELIQNEDWEGLGAYIADGINKGLQKIYDVINWDNVGPKVTKFITAFTTTFNSLVDHINWDLMGRTLGAGVNTLVNSLNLLIGNGGIDFNKIGSSIAKGLRGAIREINWTSLGELLGNKFMISWRMLSGFVNEMSRKNDAGITGWTELGKAVGKAMTGTFSRISFTDIAKALVGVINGAFETLAGFVNEFDWKSFQENLKSGIQTMVNDIDWKGNGKAFGDFLSHLCDCITAAIDNGTFQKLGEGIGEFLAELPWGKLLKTAASALIDGLGGALDGLWRSSLAGKITAGLIVAFGAVKVAQITGLDHLAAYLIGRLATKLISAENTAALTDGVETVLGNALKGATGAASDFAAALGPLVGTAGLITAMGGAATVATSELAGFVETMQGGNGIGSTFGNTMNNFIQTLQHRGDIISGSAEEIWQLKESLEQEGMTAEDKASATQKLIDKLGEMGVTSDQAEQAFSSLYQQGLITDDMFDILSESIKTLGDNTTNMAGSIDLGKQSIDDLYNNVLPQLQVQLGLSADEMVQLDTALMEAENSGGTAQDAFNRIMERAKELGINTESVAKIFAEVFPEAVRETESSAKTSMDNTKKSVETGMGAASAAIGNAMSGIKTDTEKAMSETERSVSDHTGNISTATVTNWGNSAEEVDKNLDQMKQHANLKLGEMHKTVESHFSSQYNTMTKKWERARDRIEQIISEMIRNMNIRLEGLAGNMEPVGTRIGNNLLSGISSGIRGITDTLNDVIRKVNTTVGNINNTIGNIERGFTFSYNVQLPNGGRRWGNYSLNLPRVNTVPYLATGAVIPPRSEFLAVLGDQKNGRNLEVPESLIRQIVREETGGKQGNNTYNVSVSASGRNLLDIVLEEGELRRNRNGGRNPFKLDD